MPEQRGTDPLYPEIEPYARGMLDVGDGHQIYWEEREPVRQTGSLPARWARRWAESKLRRLFDPRRYRIVLFDQRGCGQSRPARQRTGRRSQRQHYLASGCRYRAAA